MRFGIHFRRESHYFWFQTSLLLLVVSTVWSVKRYTILPMLWVEGFFIFAGIWAVVFTRGGRRETRFYSKDCIWWNWFLAVLLMLLRWALFP